MTASTPMCDCVHEREVLDLVLAERWPDRSDPDLVAHAAACEVCGEVIAVALAMRTDEAAIEAEARAAAPRHHDIVPDATLVWWRAQLRAHEDAGRKAARPIALVQGVGIGIALVAGLSLVRAGWPAMRGAMTTVSGAAADAVTRAAAVSSAWAGATPLWLTVGLIAAVIAVPVAVYAATRD